MLADSPMLARRWVKVLPHINDTLLLLAAIGLVVVTGQYPFVSAWVTAKVVGLVAYIVLGIYALRRGRTKAQRGAYWLAALAAAGYVISVALTRDPRGFLAWLIVQS